MGKFSNFVDFFVDLFSVLKNLARLAMGIFLKFCQIFKIDLSQFFVSLGNFGLINLLLSLGFY